MRVCSSTTFAGIGVLLWQCDKEHRRYAQYQGAPIQLHADLLLGWCDNRIRSLGCDLLTIYFSLLSTHGHLDAFTQRRIISITMWDGWYSILEKMQRARLPCSCKTSCFRRIKRDKDTPPFSIHNHTYSFLLQKHRRSGEIPLLQCLHHPEQSAIILAVW